MTQPQLLSLHPPEAPQDETIQSYSDRCFNEAAALLAIVDTPDSELKDWIVKKKMYGQVEGLTFEGKEGNLWTGSHSSFGHAWHCRRSVHSDLSYETFRKYLAFDHPVYEKEYMEGIKEIERIHEYSTYGAIWRSVYSMPMPLHPRDFVQLVVTREGPKSDIQPSFTVVQVPYLATPVKNQKHVRGKYVSVERVKKFVGDDGKPKIEWIMITASDAGGNIPVWMAESALTSTVCKDVPLFTEWAAKQAQE